ncbi:hypothetical protein [Leisingera methylohalidivorans]|uniref:hypothetical protein n=1 Tax=Leisingera methylohalidivorans TaxID=133924 RepID=UPI0012EBCF74|nr:hypothetical protein [Leisingera methylohalidivorans]
MIIDLIAAGNQFAVCDLARVTLSAVEQRFAWTDQPAELSRYVPELGRLNGCGSLRLAEAPIVYFKHLLLPVRLFRPLR